MTKKAAPILFGRQAEMTLDWKVDMGDGVKITNLKAVVKRPSKEQAADIKNTILTGIDDVNDSLYSKGAVENADRNLKELCEEYIIDLVNLRDIDGNKLDYTPDLLEPLLDTVGYNNGIIAMLLEASNSITQEKSRRKNSRR